MEYDTTDTKDIMEYAKKAEIAISEKEDGRLHISYEGGRITILTDYTIGIKGNALLIETDNCLYQIYRWMGNIRVSVLEA